MLKAWAFILPNILSALLGAFSTHTLTLYPTSLTTGVMLWPSSASNSPHLPLKARSRFHPENHSLHPCLGISTAPGFKCQLEAADL